MYVTNKLVGAFGALRPYRINALVLITTNRTILGILNNLMLIIKYFEAPSPMVNWSLVTGHWSLVTGHWSLVTGHWSLITGHWSLVTDNWSLITGHWSLNQSPSLAITSWRTGERLLFNFPARINSA
jgi:phosphoglucomutase/phosphopentomutase